MQDGIPLSFICAANRYAFTEWFACLNDIIHHPLLHEEEKFVWLWLATKSANNESFSCSFNYEQISLAVSKSSCKIHRILTRLRVMGFLIANLPIYYGQPTLEMVQEVHTIKLILTPKPKVKQENVNEVVLPYFKDRPAITVNLYNNRRK